LFDDILLHWIEDDATLLYARPQLIAALEMQLLADQVGNDESAPG